ncbi:MAG TPA: hypothetical protein VFY01_12565, partial [Rheinheimera sp.]|nr:hypothetical protein [Rheinheimera sp.]
VYVIDIYGQLWFVALNHNGFSNPLLVADFSQSQAIFEQPLQLAQIMAPDSNGIMRRQMMLLLTGKQQQSDILLAVKHGVTRESPWQLDDLTDRTNVSVDEQRYGIAEQLWLQIQQGGGWFVRLEQRITTLPQVYAGVVYLTSADTAHVNADCSVIAEAEPQLHAFHLHHAGVVYARRHWDIDMQHSAVLALQKDDQGQLALSLQHSQEQAAQPLLTELLTITAECADCVSAMDESQFPRLIRLATFQTEQDAH